MARDRYKGKPNRKTGKAGPDRPIVLHIPKFQGAVVSVLAAKGAAKHSIPISVETPLCGVRGGMMLHFAHAGEEPNCKRCIQRQEKVKAAGHVGTWDKKPCPLCGSKYHVPTTPRPRSERPIVRPLNLEPKRDERQEMIDQQRAKHGWDKIPRRRRR